MHEQADKGTLLAVRSVWIEEKADPGGRHVGEPPTRPREGDSLAASRGSEFPEGLQCGGCQLQHLRLYGHQEEMEEGGQVRGEVSQLAELSRPCRCPAWVIHEALVGANRTAPAAEYPRRLGH